MDVSKVAMAFALENEAIPTTLVSTASKVNIERNIRAASTVLSARERAVLEHIRASIFLPLANKHWEGVEVAQYRIDVAESSE